MSFNLIPESPVYSDLSIYADYADNAKIFKITSNIIVI